ncbi:DUF3060 domain-containing protein [Mycobacterium sp.]|uniref:DUF3060 domain-containing protein n=1 Tax=Mycobacterium sp. TaxID=1785 RepID=UPI003BACCF8B
MRVLVTADLSRLVGLPLAIAMAAAAFGLAGCSSTANPPGATSPAPTTGMPASSATATPTATSGGTTTAAIEIGDTLNYGLIGTTAGLDCADNKSLNVGGSANTLTVTGTCATVTIGGANNEITFETIKQRLSVVGLNNTITYRSGDPVVDNIGAGNTIKKG